MEGFVIPVAAEVEEERNLLRRMTAQLAVIRAFETVIRDTFGNPPIAFDGDRLLAAGRARSPPAETLTATPKVLAPALRHQPPPHRQERSSENRRSSRTILPRFTIHARTFSFKGAGRPSVVPGQVPDSKRKPTRQRKKEKPS
jgi:hypothetical protein